MLIHPFLTFSHASGLFVRHGLIHACGRKVPRRMLHASCTSPTQEGLDTLLGFGGGFLGNGLERRDRLAGKRAGVCLLACSVWRVETEEVAAGDGADLQGRVDSPFGK